MAFISGHGNIKHWRAGCLLGFQPFHNGTTDEGIDAMLHTLFGTLLPDTPWYLGFIEGYTFSNVEASDKMASHSGWQEFTQINSRPQWNVAQSNTLVQTQKSSVTPSSVNILSSGQIEGIFLTNRQFGNDGYLWATARLNTPLYVLAGDILTINYGIDISDLSSPATDFGIM